MGYEALARKWRPKTFAEVVGQGHATRALVNALSRGTIHHAYLFAGTRGVGKTTFARILARAVNCERGPTPEPCLTCPACTEILAGSAVDVQEIDGASNTGIDDVRRLRENAAYAPARLRYKVYIIDEVHMLSKAAFNGLLKILEEPPPHVVFVFATTEPNRIPDTVLSRVQRFDFRMLTDGEIRQRLVEMASAEGIPCEEEAHALLSRYAFGSLRDGQSLLEQAAVLGDGTITAPLVEEMLGLVGTEAAISLVRSVAEGNAEEAMGLFAQQLSRGADLKFLYFSLVDVLRDAAVLAFTGKEQLLFRHSPSSLGRVRQLCGLRSREEWMFLLDVAFKSERDVLSTEFPRLGFELLLLRLVNAPSLLPVEEIAEPATEGARPGPRAVPPDAGRPRTPPPVGDPPRTSFSRKEGAGGGAAPREDLLGAVRKVLEAKRKTLVVALLNQMKGGIEGDEFVISCPHQMQLDRLREEDKWSSLVEAVGEVLGRKVPIRLAASGEKKSPEDPPGNSGERIEKQAFSDPLMAEILKEFEGATLVEVREAPPRPPRPAPGEESAPEAGSPEPESLFGIEEAEGED